MGDGTTRRPTTEELERRLAANPRFRKAPPGDPDEVSITFIGRRRTEPDPEVAEMLPMLRGTRAGDDGAILQLLLHIARPAALHVGSVDGWAEGGPQVIVRGTATYRVPVTPDLIEWFADATAARGPFGRLVLQRHEDDPSIARVTVEWRGFLDGLTEEQLAVACRVVGETAKSCCVQLVNRFGAHVPTSY